MVLPALQQVNPDLGPVVDKLMADHRHVSRLLDEIEASANALVVEDGTSIRVRIVDALGDLATDLLAHLACACSAVPTSKPRGRLVSSTNGGTEFPS